MRQSMSAPLQTIIETFETRGSEAYGTEVVTQLQHALQSALLAQQDNASSALITAALLHDIGHIMSDDALPTNDRGNLNDQHEDRAYPWLTRHFSADVADPVRLHVAAKRYLCSVDPDYANSLSPASLKSYHDQGGPMSAAEKRAFESEPRYETALRLRRWDDAAKDANRETPGIREFIPYIEDALSQK